MLRGASQSFSPPTADQVASYLDRHFATGPSPMVKWMPAFLLASLILLALAWTNLGMTLVVWALLFSLLLWTALRKRQLQAVEKEVASVQELSLGRRHIDALRSAWKVIPQLRTLPELHARAVALLAHNLQQVRAHEAAVIAFGHVLGKLPSEHPAAVQLRVQQVMALLASDQLTDADSSLRRLRALMDRYPNSPISAGYELAHLYQQVRTNHFQDVVDEREKKLDVLRPLGIDAGLGHALLALACYHMSHQVDTPLLEEAQRWWDRATLLLPASALLQRFPELKVIEAGPMAAAKAAGYSPEDASTAQAGGDHE